MVLGTPVRKVPGSGGEGRGRGPGAAPPPPPGAGAEKQVSGLQVKRFVGRNVTELQSSFAHGTAVSSDL